MVSGGTGELHYQSFNLNGKPRLSALMPGFQLRIATMDVGGPNLAQDSGPRVLVHRINDNRVMGALLRCWFDETMGAISSSRGCNVGIAS